MNAADLLPQLLALPTKERAKLAQALLKVDEIDPALEAELERRDAELYDGTAQGIPLSDCTPAIERRRGERATERIAGEALETPLPANDLLAELLLLSRDERIKIAHELLKGLDEHSVASAEDEWDAEIDRRGAEVDAGTADTVSFEEYEARMRERRATRERR